LALSWLVVGGVAAKAAVDCSLSAKAIVVACEQRSPELETLASHRLVLYGPSRCHQSANRTQETHPPTPACPALCSLLPLLPISPHTTAGRPLGRPWISIFFFLSPTATPRIFSFFTSDVLQ
jgi:hypothetical protein